MVCLACLYYRAVVGRFDSSMYVSVIPLIGPPTYSTSSPPLLWRLWLSLAFGCALNRVQGALNAWLHMSAMNPGTKLVGCQFEKKKTKKNPICCYWRVLYWLNQLAKPSYSKFNAMVSCCLLCTFGWVLRFTAKMVLIGQEGGEGGRCSLSIVTKNSSQYLAEWKYRTVEQRSWGRFRINIVLSLCLSLFLFFLHAAKLLLPLLPLPPQPLLTSSSTKTPPLHSKPQPCSINWPTTTS